MAITEKKVEEVKELLNKIILLAGKSTDTFLQDAKASAKALLAPPPEDEDDNYDPDDFASSDDYYDSNC